MSEIDDFASKILSKVQADIQYRAQIRTARIVAVNGDGTYHVTLLGQNIPMQYVAAPPNANFAVGDVVTLGFSNRDKNRPEIISWRTEQPTTNPPIFDIGKTLGNWHDIFGPDGTWSGPHRPNTGTPHFSPPAFTITFPQSIISDPNEFFGSLYMVGLHKNYLYLSGYVGLYQLVLNLSKKTASLGWEVPSQTNLTTQSYQSQFPIWIDDTGVYIIDVGDQGETVNPIVQKIDEKTGAVLWTSHYFDIIMPNTGGFLPYAQSMKKSPAVFQTASVDNGVLIIAYYNYNLTINGNFVGNSAVGLNISDGSTAFSHVSSYAQDGSSTSSYFFSQLNNSKDFSSLGPVNSGSSRQSGALNKYIVFSAPNLGTDYGLQLPYTLDWGVKFRDPSISNESYIVPADEDEVQDYPPTGSVQWLCAQPQTGIETQDGDSTFYLVKQTINHSGMTETLLGPINFGAASGADPSTFAPVANPNDSLSTQRTIMLYGDFPGQSCPNTFEGFLSHKIVGAWIDNSGFQLTATDSNVWALENANHKSFMQFAPNLKSLYSYDMGPAFYYFDSGLAQYVAVNQIKGFCASTCATEGLPDGVPFYQPRPGDPPAIIPYTTMSSPVYGSNYFDLYQAGLSLNNSAIQSSFSYLSYISNGMGGWSNKPNRTPLASGGNLYFLINTDPTPANHAYLEAWDFATNTLQWSYDVTEVLGSSVEGVLSVEWISDDYLCLFRQFYDSMSNYHAVIDVVNLPDGTLKKQYDSGGEIIYPSSSLITEKGTAVFLTFDSYFLPMQVNNYLDFYTVSGS